MANTSFTHVALPVTDIEASIAFYEKWTSLKVENRVEDDGGKTARLTDGSGGIPLNLIEAPKAKEHPLSGAGHLGVGCSSREQVDSLAAEAEQAGCLKTAPKDEQYPGYHALLVDPDGHQLELAHGPHAQLNAS